MVRPRPRPWPRPDTGIRETRDRCPLASAADLTRGATATALTDHPIPAQSRLGDLDASCELDDSGQRCKVLTGDLAGFWRYRIDNRRVIVEIRDEELAVVAIGLGYRCTTYRGQRVGHRKSVCLRCGLRAVDHRQMAAARCERGFQR